MLEIIATYRDHDQASSALVRARELSSDRKIVRMLEPVSSAGFVATLEAFALAGVPTPADVGLFTVSGWDLGAPLPEVGDASPRIEAMARKLAESGNPTPWLRSLGNAALCQASIQAGFHGPSMHFVGDGHTVGLALVLAEQLLARPGTAAFVVTAFDTDPEVHSRPVGRSASVVLRTVPPEGGSITGPIVGWTPPASASTSAFSALGQLVDQADAARVEGPVLLELRR